MNSELKDSVFNFTAFKRKTGRGFKPHFALRFSVEGQVYTVGIDTSRCSKCDYYLVTHAHSDHAGKSSMLSSNSIASKKTASSLEILYERKFNGKTFTVGETLNTPFRLETFPTYHTIGSSAFSWENENGVKFLLTGDVKKFEDLPSCDVLICESNYGDPSKESNIFCDDLGKLKSFLKSERKLFLGAYRFGKAQRAAKLVRENGIRGELGMEGKAKKVTERLLDLGPFCNVGEAKVNISDPWSVRYRRNGYVLTGLDKFSQKINISDHLDLLGLESMVKHCDPEAVFPYHPDDSGLCRKFAGYIEKTLGKKAKPLHEKARTLKL